MRLHICKFRSVAGTACSYLVRLASLRSWVGVSSSPCPLDAWVVYPPLGMAVDTLSLLVCHCSQLLGPCSSWCGCSRCTVVEGSRTHPSELGRNTQYHSQILAPRIGRTILRSCE